jgi:UrcA family protein
MLRSITTAGAVVLCASLALPTPTTAGPNEVRPEAPIVRVSERVPFGDLDLNTQQGAQVMLRRIQGASARVCQQPRSPLFPTIETTMSRCRALSTGQAVAALNSPTVFAEAGRLPNRPVLTAAIEP